MERKYRPHSLLAFAEAADVLGLSRWQVRAMADDGRFPCYVVPGDVRRIRRIKYADLMAMRTQIEASACCGSRRVVA